MSPLEQAFALLGMTGPCGAKETIEAGIVDAAADDVDRIEAWKALGECVNRIFARQTCH